MAAKVSKLLHYRRAVFSAQGVVPRKLEHYVGQAFRGLEIVAERTVDVGGKSLQGAAYEVKDHVGCFLHVVTYIEGDKASTVPTRRNEREVDLVPADAPDGSEFSDGDIHALISGDNVLFCSTGLKDSTLKRYLDAIFKQQGVQVPSYEVKPAATEDAVKMLGEGVREIGINVAADKADLQYAVKAGEQPGFREALSHLLSSFAGHDKKLDEALRRSDVNVGIRIQATGKVKEDDVRLDLLGEVGQYVIEDDEEENFYIVTRKGTRITSKDISIKQSARMERNAKSVFRREAWDSLEKMLGQLREAGIIDG